MNFKKIFQKSTSSRNVVINGSVFGGRIVVNGKIVDQNNLITKSFDEQKTESMNDVDTIRINSSCPVKISSSDSMNAVAHFFGNSTFYGEVNFNVEKNWNELVITVLLDGIFENTDLCLDISISKLKKYKNIFIETSASKIEFLDSFISSENITFDTSSGQMTIRGKFNNIDIKSSSSNIDLKTEYANNLTINNSSGKTNIVGDYKQIKIDSSSSNFIIESKSVEKIKFDSSSGSLKLIGGFKNIDISTSSTAVQVKSNFNEYFKIDNTSGEIMLDGVFKDLIIKAIHAKITSNIEAISDVNISLDATSGKTNFNLANIKKVNISGDKVSGKISNNHFERENGYVANLKYDIISCNITIN